MEFLLILCSALAIQAAAVEKEKQDDEVIINNVYHDVEVLKTDLDRPYMLATDFDRNIVYFSYSLNPDDTDFKSAYVNLNTKEFFNIDKVKNGFAQTVDQKTHDVYIGSNNGIYKYDQQEDKAELFAEEGSDIWSMHFNDELYFTTSIDQALFVVIDGYGVRIRNLKDTKVEHFVVDNDGDVIFSNGTGLYSQTKDSKDAVLYQEFANQDIRGITTDTKGEVYICAIDGIYRVEKSNVTLVKLVDLDYGFGVAFDKDNNIIYSNDTSLFRLKPNRDKSF